MIWVYPECSVIVIRGHIIRMGELGPDQGSVGWRRERFRGRTVDEAAEAAGAAISRW